MRVGVGPAGPDTCGAGVGCTERGSRIVVTFLHSSRTEAAHELTSLPSAAAADCSTWGALATGKNPSPTVAEAGGVESAGRRSSRSGGGSGGRGTAAVSQASVAGGGGGETRGGSARSLAIGDRPTSRLGKHQPGHGATTIRRATSSNSTSLKQQPPGHPDPR